MALEPGTRFGHYEIFDQIGKGGMGEVYRARDTQLGREVAIKVLPPEFARDEERLARLEREARMLAALNHPNIAAIYGLEHSDLTRFLVLELVEGDTLAYRLKRGALSVGESLKLALQIAEALGAAHEKGVIHRDLKPANVKVTPEGRVKVLDFGLAKAFAGDHSDVALSNSPTLSLQATERGVILGTAAYMSPEQARGEAADQRGDIWAFGCVLLEMLSGRAAFDGQTVSDILASVLKTEPDWTTLPPATPPRIRFLLERCLEKDRNDRCQGISEVRAEIRRVLAEPKRLRPEAAGVFAPTRRASRLPWVATAILGTVLVGFIVWRGTEVRPVPDDVVRFDYVLPEGTDFRDRGPAAPALAVSPDGQSFLYNGTGGFYIRSLDDFEARLIPETNGNLRIPVFSPDGQEIAYWNTDTNELMKIAISGGQATKLADLDGYVFGLSWTGSTVLYGQEDGIWGVPERGGSPRRVITTQPGEQAAGARFLPGNDRILYAVTSANGDNRWNDADIVVESLSAPGDRHVLLEGGSDPRYLRGGHLVYSLGNRLYAAALGLETLEVGADHVEMIQGIDRTAGRAFYSAQAAFDIADNGTLIWAPESLGTNTDELVLAIGDREGQTDLLTDTPRPYRSARMSPVDERVAVEIDDSTGDEPVRQIYILEAGELRQLTFEGTINRFPTWTPDGKSIIFASNQGGGSLDIYRRPADFSGAAELVYASPNELWPSNVSVDDILAFVEFPDGGTQRDIWTLDLNGGAEPTVFLDTEADETSPWFSPDGRALAFQSGVPGGAARVWVRPFPGGAEALQIGVPGEPTSGPVWFSDPQELVYIQNNPVGLMAIRVETTPSLRFAGEAQPAGYGGGNAAVTPGGQLSPWAPASGRRMIAAGFPVAPGGPRIKVELNWVGELNERVPTP